MSRTAAALAFVAVVAGSVGAAQADPPWKRGHHPAGLSDCKYQFKSGPGGVKESYKCKGGRGGPPAWAPGPPHARPNVATLPPIEIGGCHGEFTGQMIGGVIGALAGSRIGEGQGKLAAVAGGTLLGFLVGGEIGRGLDAGDAACAAQVFEAAPTGQPIIWQNPRTETHYHVVPVGSSEEGGRYCREYQAKVTVGDKVVDSYGTACRQPDGSWQIVG